MENSFSLEFNPLTNVRAVKEYEEEIQRLKREVFELKTRLTHASGHPAVENLPKLLYEQNERLAQVSQEKSAAEKQLDEARVMLNQTAQEKMLVENKYNQDIFAANDRMALLEDENKRLLLRIDKLSREIQEIDKLKASHQELEMTCTNYKNFINNLENQLEQTKYEFNSQIQEYEARLEEMRQHSQADTSNRRYEMDSLRKQLDVEMSANKNNQLIINDLKETVTNEIRERARLQNELGMASGKLRADYSKQLEHCNALLVQASKDGEGFVNGMNRFRTVMKERLDSCSEKMERFNARLEAVLHKTTLSSENQAFINKLRIAYTGYDELVDGLRRAVAELHKKAEILKKETSDATFFAENNQRHMESKTLKLLEEFHKQFSEAKSELVFCKRYLMKKSEENKNLKNENAHLQRELEVRQLGADNNIYSGLAAAVARKPI